MNRLLALSTALAAGLASASAHGQYYHYDRHHHHDHDDEAAAAIIGGVVGAIAGYAIGSSRHYGYYGRPGYPYPPYGYYGRSGYPYPPYGYVAPAYPYAPPPPLPGYGYGYYGGPYGYYGGYRPYRRVDVAPYAYRRYHYRRY